MTRRLIIALVVIALGVLGIPLSQVVYAWFTDTDRLAGTVRNLGFIPLNPPSALRGPGAIYYINKNGRDFALLCSIDQQWLTAVLRESTSPSTSFSELTSGRFGFEGSLSPALGGSSDTRRLRNVSFTLEKAKIYEIAIDDLVGLVDRITNERPVCAKVMKQYLESGDYVCQIQQALRATARYAIKRDDKSTGEGSITAAELKETIKMKIDPEAHAISATEVVGDDLYYGAKLAPYCLSLPGKFPPTARFAWYQRAYDWFFGS